MLESSRVSYRGRRNIPDKIKFEFPSVWCHLARSCLPKSLTVITPKYSRCWKQERNVTNSAILESLRVWCSATVFIRFFRNPRSTLYGVVANYQLQKSNKGFVVEQRRHIFFQRIQAFQQPRFNSFRLTCKVCDWANYEQFQTSKRHLIESRYLSGISQYGLFLITMSLRKL